MKDQRFYLFYLFILFLFLFIFFFLADFSFHFRGTTVANIYSVKFSPDSKFLVVTSDKGTVHLFAAQESFAFSLSLFFFSSLSFFPKNHHTPLSLFPPSHPTQQQRNTHKFKVKFSFIWVWILLLGGVRVELCPVTTSDCAEKYLCVWT